MSQPKKLLTSHPGVQTTLAPAASEVSTLAMRPCPWNRGITFKHRSVSFSTSAAHELRADVQMLACVSGTIFGRDVVPDVRNSSATSAGAIESSDGVPPWSPVNMKRPAFSSSAVDSSTIWMPHESATRRAGESNPAAVSNARGRRSAKYLSSSSDP